MTKHSSVVAFGELLWDLLPSGPVLGGAPANFAFRLQSMGIPVRLVSRIGDDEYGARCLQLLQGHGLAVDLIQRDGALPTGTVEVTLSPEGNASYVIREGVAYDAVSWTPQLAHALSEARLICFGTLVQRAETTCETLYKALQYSAHADRLLDVNLRKKCFTPNSVLRSFEHATIVKLNDDESLVVGEMLALESRTPLAFAQAAVERFDLKACLVTRGSNGVVAAGANGECVELPGIAVKVVDTVGSGDSFTAGFVAKYLEGLPLAACCEWGNRYGAAAATTRGGMSPVNLSVLESELANSPAVSARY